MKGTPAIYLGRIVNKKHFRTFVYGPQSEKKCVESWDEFQAAMQSGMWFATLDEVNVVEKPKRKSRAKLKPVIEEVEEPLETVYDDGSVFEVTTHLNLK